MMSVIEGVATALGLGGNGKVSSADFRAAARPANFRFALLSERAAQFDSVRAELGSSPRTYKSVASQ